MTEEEFQVGDLVKLNPLVMGGLGSEVILRVEEIMIGRPQPVRASIVRHNNSSLIGEEVYLYKSWLCYAPIKSKFERRTALCK